MQRKSGIKRASILLTNAYEQTLAGGYLLLRGIYALRMATWLHRSTLDRTPKTSCIVQIVILPVSAASAVYTYYMDSYIHTIHRDLHYRRLPPRHSGD
ncbi:hypothetical protein F4806DRAFT_476413 [Annulohypoxylon nitens]|nr:hypothetical protein F4806DRAFT_476413 [Annulohypoxylon nitens]